MKIKSSILATLMTIGALLAAWWVIALVLWLPDGNPNTNPPGYVSWSVGVGAAILSIMGITWIWRQAYKSAIKHQKSREYKKKYEAQVTSPIPSRSNHPPRVHGRRKTRTPTK